MFILIQPIKDVSVNMYFSRNLDSEHLVFALIIEEKHTFVTVNFDMSHCMTSSGWVAEWPPFGK